MAQSTIFKDREEAGKALAKKLDEADLGDAVVFGLPRGGVPIAYQVAKRFELPLDTVIARKLGAPQNPEYAFGAIAPGDVVILNDAIIESQGIEKAHIDLSLAKERIELDRRMVHYKSGEFTRGRRFETAVIIDDGLATGMSARAAIESVKLVLKPKRVIFATPVCSQEAFELVEGVVDEVICVSVPEYFLTVGQWYERFNQITDDEVLYLLHTAHDARTGLAEKTR